MALPPDDAEFLSHLGQEARRKQQVRESQLAAKNKEERRVHRMRRLLDLAAEGEPDHPVADARGRPIIDSLTWAQHIVRLARAWRECVGVDGLIDRPLPDKGLAIDAAHRIFAMACARANVGEVAAALETARATFGEYTDLFSVTALNDSKQALVIFFSQLRRYHNGFKWQPPVVARPQAAAIAPVTTPDAVPTRATPVERSEPVESSTTLPDRGLLPAQQERVRQVIEALGAHKGEYLTRKELTYIGVSPQTVDADCHEHGHAGDKQGGGQGMARVRYRRAYVQQFVQARWNPKVQ